MNLQQEIAEFVFIGKRLNKLFENIVDKGNFQNQTAHQIADEYGNDNTENPAREKFKPLAEAYKRAY